MNRSKHLPKEGLLYKQDTIVDATFIEATDSRKANKSDAPEFSIGTKEKQRYYGMKAHVGVDSKSGLVHSVSVSKASRKLFLDTETHLWISQDTTGYTCEKRKQATHDVRLGEPLHMLTA